MQRAFSHVWRLGLVVSSRWFARARSSSELGLCMEKRLLFSVFMEERVLLRAPGSVTANQIAVGIELLCSFPASEVQHFLNKRFRLIYSQKLGFPSESEESAAAG